MSLSPKIKLPFALDENGMIVHIANVESGEKCNCICIKCKSSLIAVKGKIKQHHFRHKNDAVCTGGLESAIHLAAKQEIRIRKQLTLPDRAITASRRDTKGVVHSAKIPIVRDKQIILFDEVQEEKPFHGMKVDLLCIKGHSQLIIEVFYRHKVDDEKIKKIRKANVSAIQIDLSGLTPEDVKNTEAFWSYINSASSIHWLHNVKEQHCALQLKRQLEAKIRKIEEKYICEEINKRKEKANEIEKEKINLLVALEDLKELRSKRNIMQLKCEAEMHPAWKHHSQYLKWSFQELPSFLNHEVPDGDWIFGCDRRIWQTALYVNFIQNRYGRIFIERINEWLNFSAKCETPVTAIIAGTYGRRYPNLIPSEVLHTLPSTWRTLLSYCKHLEKLGLLEYSPSKDRSAKDTWFRVISNKIKTRLSL